MLFPQQAAGVLFGVPGMFNNSEVKVL